MMHLKVVTAFSGCTIFTNKREALQTVKKYPGSRFKIFSKLEDATQFSQLPPDVIPPSPVPADKRTTSMLVILISFFF